MATIIITQPNASLSIIHLPSKRVVASLMALHEEWTTELPGKKAETAQGNQPKDRGQECVPLGEVFAQFTTNKDNESHNPKEHLVLSGGD
jgi:hypothetical protein